ncbi:hypothetical protein E2493_15590 [Sphingomonas parva]|uniref:Cytochrome c domain-containing protein n=1 Tax=Sphingomonas parva TaxID=2555898 RepID=A0A4Y8ZMP7_9SPHN|nr:hypothetical protein [Sphingomonas parva]TFI57293.1 hypothetical protein E2493_15590 [Sphingomonas parva]
MIRKMLMIGLLGSIVTVSGCRQSEDTGNKSEAKADTTKPQSLAAGSGQCDTPTTPFCDSTVALPAGWTGNVFKLAQDYPQQAPQDAQPWLAFDPLTQPQQYIASVLAYFYEGNIRPNVEDSFNPALNSRRRWYNAPWQDYGFNGREPVHGLTRERVSNPGELAPQQSQMWNNYAVGFYNAPGGTAIGRVWANHGAPDPAQGILPEGSVAAKLLFTTAGPDQVPYLAGAPTWNAFVYKDVNAAKPPNTRAILPVRLLQIDIAVKDKRAPLGWVFGTFVYGGGPGGKPGQGWTNVAPVGVMWGNDPGYSGTGPLKETWLNPAVRMPHVGYQGRLNGPVDNPASSCMSCHMTAQAPVAPMFPAKFTNLPAGGVFQPPATSLDYSLQLAIGVENFKQAKALATAPQNSPLKARLQAQATDPLPPRDGATSH